MLRRCGELLVARFCLLAAGGLLLAVVLAGCAAPTRRRLVSLVFDGAGTPPPTRRVRRDLLREIEELKHTLADATAASRDAQALASSSETRSSQPGSPAIEQATGWKAAAALLPKDGGGQVDWVTALKAGIVAPRPAVDPHAPRQAIFDFDVELARSGVSSSAVTFSHAAHTEWLSCQGCHPEPFALGRHAPPAVTMAAIRQGKFCGACHGSVAFGVSSCARCHAMGSSATAWRPSRPPATLIETVHRWDEAQRMLPAASDGTPDWTAALVRGVTAPRPAIDPAAAEEPILAADVVRVPAGAAEYAVTFPHAPHTAVMHCESCHPDPFQQKAGATPMSMDQVNNGELCGRCHGTVAFSTMSCARCHTQLEE